jgi:hypothetical protein
MSIAARPAASAVPPVPAGDPGGLEGDLEVPSSWSPLVIVVLAHDAAEASAVVAPVWEASWQMVATPATGRRGADLKRAFGEGLRRGGQCLVAWPGELSDWRALVPRLLRPIFAQRAEIVLAEYTPEACENGLRPLPASSARRLFGYPHAFVPQGPLAVTRRALDLIPFEANADGPLFEHQLLAQARHFGVEVAPVTLPPEAYRTMADRRGGRGSAGGLGEILCDLERIAHRWGLVESPRFHAPQATSLSRWVITNDKTR